MTVFLMVSINCGQWKCWVAVNLGIPQATVFGEQKRSCKPLYLRRYFKDNWQFRKCTFYTYYYRLILKNTCQVSEHLFHPDAIRVLLCCRRWKVNYWGSTKVSPKDWRDHISCSRHIHSAQRQTSLTSLVKWVYPPHTHSFKTSNLIKMTWLKSLRVCRAGLTPHQFAFSSRLSHNQSWKCEPVSCTYSLRTWQK